MGIDQLHLVCPLFDSEGLVGEKIASFAFDQGKLKNIEPKATHIFLYHSKDDPVVPFSHSRKYSSHLKKANQTHLKFGKKQQLPMGHESSMHFGQTFGLTLFF